MMMHHKAVVVLLWITAAITAPAAFLLIINCHW